MVNLKRTKQENVIEMIIMALSLITIVVKTQGLILSKMEYIIQVLEIIIHANQV